MRFLFVAGCPRSGTTPVTKYLNLHPDIALTVERFKPNHVTLTPDLFTPDRLLDFQEGETAQASRHTDKLVGRKRERWDELAWVGDKHPIYFRKYDELAQTFPGVRFIYTYRPLSPVARSFASKGWSRPMAVQDGVEMWRESVARTRALVESGAAPLLVVDYDSFFSEPERWLPVLSDFLEIPFAPRLASAWREVSEISSGRRKPVREMNDDELAVVESGRDEEAENWVAGQIETQFAARV